MITRNNLLLVCALFISIPALAFQAVQAPAKAPVVAAPKAETEVPVDGLLDQDDVMEAAAEITALKYPDAETVLVGEYVRTEYQADGSYVTFDDEYVKVLTEEGRKEALEKQFGYNAFYGGMKILAVEVIKPNGQIASFDPATISKEQVDRSQMSSNIYDPNDKVVVAAAKNVEIGDTVRFFVQSWESKPRMKDNYSDFSVLEQPSPIKHVVYEFIAPKDKPLRTKIVLSEIKGTVTYAEKTDGGKITYTWTGKDIPQMFLESSMPAWYTVGQRLLVSTLANWKEVSQWYSKLTQPHLEKTTPEMKAKVAEITAGMTTDDQRINAIFKFVSQEIRYMGITTETDAPGYEPHDVSTTFENRYGVCRDKAALLVAMLSAAGIPSFPVLINNGEKLDVEAPRVGFNHAITAARGKDGTYILMDSTDESTSDLLPQYLQNKSYLVATPEGETLMTSPIAPASENMMFVKTNVTLADDGSAVGSTTVNFQGINDNVYRGMFVQMKPSDVRRAFESAIKGILPGATLTGLKLTPENMQDSTQKIQLVLNWTVPNLLVAGGGAAQLNLPFTGYGFSVALRTIGQGLQLDKRKYTLDLNVPCGVHEDLQIKLPMSLQNVIALPQYENTDHKDFSITQAITAKPGELNASIDIQVKSPEIAPDAYLMLKKAMANMEINARQQPVFARKSSVTPPPPPTADVELISSQYALRMDSPTSWTTHQVVKEKILTVAGKKSASELQFDFNPLWQTVEIESAQVTQKDGTVRKIQPQEMNTLDAEWVASAPRYAGGKTLVVSLPGVEVGSIIEYSVKQTAKDQPIFSKGYTFASSESVKNVELSYDFPEDIKPRMEIDFPTDGHMTDRTKDGRRKITFVWNDISPRTREASAPPSWMDAPDFVMTTSTWPEYAKAVGQQIAPLCMNQAASIAKANELIAGKTTPIEKITAIRDFVALQIRMEGPGFSELPLAAAFSPADVTLKDGYGHWSDRSILLYAMLKGAGFEPELDLASWGTKEPTMQKRSFAFPSSGYFAGIVCRVKQPQTGEWLPLDDLSQYAPLGATSLGGQPGYTMDGKPFVWAEPSGLENFGETEIALDFDAQGTALIAVTSRYHGTDHEGFVRQQTEMTPEERSRYFQSLVSGIAQNAKPEGELVTTFTYPGTMKYAVKVERFGVKNAGGLYFDLPSVPQQIMPTDADRRERGLLFAGEEKSKIVWKVTAPAGLVPVIAPENLDWRGPGNLGTVKFNAEPNTSTDATRLTYSLDIDLAPAVIPVGNYSSLLDLNRRFSHPSARRVLLQPAIAAEKSAPKISAPEAKAGV